MAKSSQKDIATALNVSKTTISWILSGKGAEKGFSASTIERVIKYAQEVNYQPNLLARSLSIGSSKTIGLIIPAIGDTFFTQLSKAVGMEASKNNYTLTVCYSDGNGDRELQLIKQLRAMQVDGLIIAPSNSVKNGISNLKKEGFPFVLVDRYYPDLTTNYVVVNNEESSYKLVNHLVQKGRKKIAILTADYHLLVIKNRIEGYKRALDGSGIEFDEKLVLKISRAEYKKDIIKVLDHFFDEQNEVDGFFFSTHYLALEAFRYFKQNNINIDQFGMVCYHEMPALDILAPKMSIARMPIETIGREAVRMLMKNMVNKEFEYQGLTLENIIEFND